MTRPPTSDPAPSAVDAVLFDLDGTLVDTKALYIAAYQRAVEPFVRDDLTEADIFALRPTSEVAFIRAVVAEDDFEACLERFYHVYEELHAEHVQGVFPGVTETLRSLRSAGLALGLVTGKSRRSWEVTRMAVDTLPDFDVLVLDDDVRAPKPDPHGLEIALKALAVPAARTVYVGDTLSDMQAARAAGLRPAAALWSFDRDRRARQIARVRPTGAVLVRRPELLPGLLGLG